MTYIIDPIWFYWINVLDGLRDLFFAILLISSIVTVCLFFMDRDMVDIDKKWTIIGIVVTIVCAILVIIIPSKEIMEKMLIAHLISKENINLTMENIKELIDYISNAISTQNA